MLTAIWIAVGAVGGWFLKGVADKALQQFLARSGRVGYVAKDFGFFTQSQLADGRTVLGHYSPNNMFKDERVHELRAYGDLYNDSEVPVLLKEPSVTFWGLAGPSIRHRRVRVLVGSEEPAIITIPANGRVAVTVVMQVFRDDLADTYSSTLPVLECKDVSGRERQFRLSTASFYGTLAVWPRKGRLPVLNDKRSSLRITDARGE